ncbi:cell division cycle-associated protein 7-like [Electrophorus electricus]|uniref:cell division cycle-associated protein 7-like n=1 Tax=Electrophorus electricus TaxID=8005 RepID=UPI0015CFF7B6|nr:cell division cycle-associated protein 7-like [Electrophorus electricus]
MSELCKELAGMFSETGDDETFLGFSDSELKECIFKDSESDSDGKSTEHVSQKAPARQGFTLRIALRTRSLNDVPEEDDDCQKEKRKMLMKKAISPENIKLEMDEAQNILSSPYQLESDDGGDDSDSFLEKRAMNIQANKAMLAQLMSDLQKMTGPLLNTEHARKKERRSDHGVRVSTPRRNPERASRRMTRSMAADFPATQISSELEVSLEDELMKIHSKPQRREPVRPRQAKPHIMRRVEEVTEDELELVATNMTEKIYNRVTGTTCHQCRQKTVDTKTSCRSENCRGVQGQFCGPCLRNRYGEDVRTALLDPSWQCPPCRGICNCSYCRQRHGCCATGILFPLVQHRGFSDVHSYLCSLRGKLEK